MIDHHPRQASAFLGIAAHLVDAPAFPGHATATRDNDKSTTVRAPRVAFMVHSNQPPRSRGSYPSSVGESAGARQPAAHFAPSVEPGLQSDRCGSPILPWLPTAGELAKRFDRDDVAVPSPYDRDGASRSNRAVGEFLDLCRMASRRISSAVRQTFGNSRLRGILRRREERHIGPASWLPASARATASSSKAHRQRPAATVAVRSSSMPPRQRKIDDAWPNTTRIPGHRWRHDRCAASAQSI